MTGVYILIGPNIVRQIDIWPIVVASLKNPWGKKFSALLVLLMKEQNHRQGNI
jgi:hypothetical protein